LIPKYLHALSSQQAKWGRILHHEVLPQRAAQLAGWGPLPWRQLEKPLIQAGIRQLYVHQAASLEQIRAGHHVVVATPTASGKSLIYNLAVAESLLTNRKYHALYLFPTKALSRDQFNTVSDFLAALEAQPPLSAAIYDGDTTPYQRAKIRQQIPHVLLTNPDMLHYALLAYHNKWEEFWRALRFVVIDELHTYRGVFGSHVAQIVRRLNRIAQLYGSKPQYILLSATIANPQALAEQLIDRPVQVVATHGAPQAKRHFIFLQAEEAPATIAARLVVEAAQLGIKTIAFTQSRKLTELVHMSVLRMAPQLRRKVSSYRAGFLPEERRAIEQDLASGALAAVISTSALEVGIDIGALDLCILVGYPGTIMTTWQRGGRVGRGGQESAIILVPQVDALDQYIVQHPQEFLHSHYEVAVVDPINPEILRAHLPCAAAEIPLRREEVEQSPEAVDKMVQALVQSGGLRQTADGQQWLAGGAHPHRSVDIRSVGEAYTILTKAVSGDDKWVPLGKSDGVRALKECHPGAIYLHRGQQYQVASLDLKNRVIRAENKPMPYFTRVKSEKETEILEVLASKPVANFLIRLGRLRVTEQITGYEKRRLFSQELLDLQPLELPPQTFETVGFWLEIEPGIADAIRQASLHFMGGIHAVEHAAISMFPLFALCDRNDIGGIAYPLHPQLAKSAIFIYDGYPGGIGLAARGYEIIGPLLEKTKALIASCPCAEGCPACIHSPKCGAGNKPLDKQAALTTLRYLLGELNLPSKGQSPTSPAETAIPGSDRPADTPRYRIGFFDLETQRLADEVGGWHNKHLMRVSVAVLYESHTGAYRTYREEDVPRLIEHLQQLDLIVGFNIKGFDYEVLKAYTAFKFNQLPTFDLLEKIHQQLGFRLSLDHLAEKTLGKSKLADGIQAVRWFREGQWEPLTRYCREDVALTRELFTHCLEKGYLLYADRRGTSLRLPTPWTLEDLIPGKT
jgi:DEAD/DEAH box helicase domain-containing protein